VTEMVPAVEAVAGARQSAREDSLQWTRKKGVKWLPWADVHLMVVEGATIAAAVTAAEEAAVTVAADPAVDVEVPEGAAAETRPGVVHRAAAGVDLPPWILSNAGKSLPWADVHHMEADVAAMGVVETAVAEAAATDEVQDVAEVQVEAVPAVEVPGAGHVK
jgi:hypothetical protein